MSDITVIPATAMAAVNAVVVAMKVGLFMSEYEKVRVEPLQHPRFKGASLVIIEGRTNTGFEVATTNVVVRKTQKDSNTFPFEKVFVTIMDPGAQYSPDTGLNYECVFQEDRIEIGALPRSPLAM